MVCGNSAAEGEEFTVGQSISVELFADVKKVDVTGTSKGKGFAGTVKRLELPYPGRYSR